MSSITSTKSAEEPTAADSDQLNEYEDAEKNYNPKSLKFWTILIGMYLSIFLVALVSSLKAAKL
jgi:hypothetical protein